MIYGRRDFFLFFSLFFLGGGRGLFNTSMGGIVPRNKRVTDRLKILFFPPQTVYMRGA